MLFNILVSLVSQFFHSIVAHLRLLHKSQWQQIDKNDMTCKDIMFDQMITFSFVPLKCHYDQILDIHCFYIFVHHRSFLAILVNFKLLRELEPIFFRPLFPRIYGRH